MPDASSTGKITAFRVGGFHGFTLDGDFRLDGLGSVGPDTARNSGDGHVTFLFSDGVSATSESSYFFFLDTQATTFSNTGSYVLLCADNDCISQQFTTFAPTSMPNMPNLQSTEIIFDTSTAMVGGTVFFDSGVNNTGDVDTGVFNIQWLVNGQDVGAAGSHAGVPAGQTVLDGNSQFSWTFDSPGTYSVTFTVDFDNQIEESNEGDNTGSVQVTVAASGLEGPDANGDGVWDDIEGYIDQTYPDSTTRAALRAIAVAMQSAMLVANDPAASVNAATALQRTIECLYFVRPDDARAVKNDVKAVLLNTLERSKAYLRFSDQLGGQIFPTTPLSELQSACNF